MATRNFLRLYRRVLTLLFVERRIVGVLVLANATVAALFFLEPVLFGRLIDVLTRATQRPPEDTWRASLLMLGTWGTVGAMGILANFGVALAADRLVHRRRLAVTVDYFDHVLGLSYDFHAGTHSARLLHIMMQATRYMASFWLSFLREHLATIITLTVLLPLSMLLNWKLALLLILFMAVFIVLNVLGNRRTEAAQGAVETSDSEVFSRSGDAFANALLLQSYGRREMETENLRDLTGRLLRMQYPVLTYWAGINVFTRTASTITIIGIFLLGTLLTLRGEATVGEIVTFMGFAGLLIGRLEQVGRYISQMFVELPALSRFFQVLDTVPRIPERDNAVELPRVRGDVAFHHVSFAYGRERPAVSELTFSVPAGTSVALVGPTGSGKTTTVSLLARLRDPDSGSITIDGVDTRDASLRSLRQNIGIVFQDSSMLHRSIADNIRIGRPGASDEDIMRAARLAEAHDFVMRQAQGYQTVVGERGSTLSGGERQRIAIARAFLKDPPILILDEATSALDTVTEASIQRALAVLTRGRTTFIIAHRLSTVRNAGLILVFDRGRIVECGTHSELLAREGLYAQLVRVQLEHEPGNAPHSERRTGGRRMT
jgi:ATP-binding cassette subfamily B protein